MRVSSRDWIVVVNMLEEDDQEVLAPWEWPGLKFAVWQLEMGESGTVHWQCFFSFEEPLRLAALHKLDGLARAACKKRRGTKQQAMVYACKRDETALEATQWWPSEEAVRRLCDQGAGKRTDLEELATMVKAGLTDHQIADYAPTYVLKYQRGIRDLRTAHFVQGREANEIDSIVYVGPTGTGKSFRLRAECPEGPDWFWVKKGKWFDGYQMQPGLVFDEFRDSWMSHSDMLSLVDVYPRKVEIKGAVIQMYATRFRFSSNVHPADWWNMRPNLPNWVDDPLRRRIRHIVPMEEVWAGPEIVHVDNAAHLIRRRADGQQPLVPGDQGQLMWNGRDYE